MKTDGAGGAGASPGAAADRDCTLDLLKVVGLACIVIAHTGPPSFILFLRSFDVPLMVLAAGAAFALSCGDRCPSWPYVRRRAFRLLAPTWGFLLFFFATAWIVFRAGHKPYPFSPQTVAASFALSFESGIGYVWIVHVFLLVAVVSPLLFRLRLATRGEGMYLALLLLLFAAGQIVRTTAGASGLLLNELLYLLAYGFLFGLGFRLPHLGRKQTLFITGVSLAALAASAGLLSVWGLPLQLDRYKYPPAVYYTAYGLSASLVLYLALGKLRLRGRARTAVTFLSASSLRIYLWHIFFLYYWGLLTPRFPQASGWFTGFAGISVLSIAATVLQQRIGEGFFLKTGLGRRNAGLVKELFIR